MEHYVGLDVSLKRTSICVVDRAGNVLSEATVNSEPEEIARFLTLKAPGAVRIGIEAGPTSLWLCTELRALGFPTICIDARHALLQSNHRQSDPLQAVKKRGRVSRADNATIRVRRDRLDRPYLEAWRCNVAELPVRSGRRAAHSRAEMVEAEGVGPQARQAHRDEKGQGRRRPQARSHSASHVDRRHRLPMVY